MSNRFNYETVTGFFLQDEPTTDDATFDYTNNFGLLPSLTWSQFQQKIGDLNDAAPAGISYRFLLLGRHGEGWHNVAEAKFGTEAWDAYYSLLDSYDGMVFLDAHLTDKGKHQAGVLAHETFRRALKAGMPAPERYYCSPLDRCLETCSLTFTGLTLPDDRPFRPMVRELLRECIGEHTCDKRSRRSEIEATWPGFEYEREMAEEDSYWRKDWRESDPEMDARLQKFLDEMFEHDQGSYLSLTAHSGAIGSLLRVLGHRPFRPGTGAVVPVVIKVVRV